MFLQRPRSMCADHLSRRLRRLLLASTILASACLAALIFLQTSRHQLQMQDDSHVATVWVAGVTYGPAHKLTRGSWLLQWLNDRGIYALGRAETITSRYAG